MLSIPDDINLGIMGFENGDMGRILVVHETKQSEPMLLCLATLLAAKVHNGEETNVYYYYKSTAHQN